jgi:AcrR family transcriptional regulator
MDSSLDDLIMSAALDLVGEVGYEKVSMDAIASRSGTSKATIYRRWDSKAALVTHAVSCRKAPSGDLPDTGDLGGDLRAALTLLSTQFRDEDLDLMAGLLTALRSDAKLAVLVREHMVNDKKDVWNGLVERAAARGELSASVDPHILDEIVGGIIFLRLIVTGEPVDAEFITHLVDDILLPVLRGASSRT